MYYLYILRGPKDHLYIGVTSNLDARIKRHKSGDGAEFTKRNQVFELVYTEQYRTLSEARRRELQIKRYKGGNAFKKLIGINSGPVV